MVVCPKKAEEREAENRVENGSGGVLKGYECAVIMGEEGEVKGWVRVC